MTSLDRIIEHLEGLAEQIDITLSAARALKGQDEVQGTLTSGPQKDDWIEVGAAASRFEISKGRIQAWCQRDDDFGWKRGGRWYVSIPKMRARLGIK